ncbi:MAG: hypothetical protein RBG13Loki_2333 [Promethearchaeota archaeon CR_4]|nr:MAG: hypothetical protein RBG13Loki_2333 [Candidatus Lokiarchaeota archaeon CR_4]
MLVIKITEIMRRELVKLSIDTPISVIAKTLWDKNVGSVLIYDGKEDNIVGFIDDRAIFKLIAENRNPLEVKSSTIFKKLECVPKSLTVKEMWEKYGNSNHKRFGIVDENSKVIGILRKKTLATIHMQLLKEELGIEL